MKRVCANPSLPHLREFVCEARLERQQRRDYSRETVRRLNRRVYSGPSA